MDGHTMVCKFGEDYVGADVVDYDTLLHPSQLQAAANGRIDTIKDKDCDNINSMAFIAR